MNIARSNSIKIILIMIALFILLGSITGCSRLTYIPGASYGYYLWEEDGIVHIEWSVDRKDTDFSGYLSTDGEISGYELTGWEDADKAELKNDTLSFNSTLGPEDYSDGILIKIADYNYIEFDLRINDGYDLSRVHMGAFLENPKESPFQIDQDYFKEVRAMAWYERHPFSGFFHKLFSNKYFTFPYIFILGIIVIEILRITAFKKTTKKAIFIPAAYLVLVLIEIGIFFLLRFMVL